MKSVIVERSGFSSMGMVGADGFYWTKDIVGNNLTGKKGIDFSGPFQSIAEAELSAIKVGLKPEIPGYVKKSALNAWNKKHGCTAESEGWSLFETSEGGFELQKDDDAKIFADDETVVSCVISLAAKDSDSAYGDAVKILSLAEISELLDGFDAVSCRAVASSAGYSVSVAENGFRFSMENGNKGFSESIGGFDVEDSAWLAALKHAFGAY